MKKVGIKHSFDNVVWDIYWIDYDNIEQLVYDISVFIETQKSIYGQIFVEREFIYD